MVKNEKGEKLRKKNPLCVVRVKKQNKIKIEKIMGKKKKPKVSLILSHVNHTHFFL
jgi:hypothetical protein